mmetsp:Transcript_2119/g.5367  ORF Transcript_2119/g.5367 Transcript_2119/m.5367 type:complete len:226 (+) Transcript_2119:1416-2093(+)
MCALHACMRGHACMGCGAGALSHDTGPHRLAGHEASHPKQKDTFLAAFPVLDPHQPPQPQTQSHSQRHARHHQLAACMTGMPACASESRLDFVCCCTTCSPTALNDWTKLPQNMPARISSVPAAANTADHAAAATCCPSTLCTPWRPTIAMRECVTMFGSTPSRFIACSSSSAWSYCRARSHAASSALYTCTVAGAPSRRMRRRTSSAASQLPASECAAIRPQYA